MTAIGVVRLSKLRHLEVELHPRVEGGAICLTSGRQWMRLGRLRMPLPRWLAGQARVCEWEEPDGTFGIRVVIHNPILGDFFGYEGSFQPDRSTV